MLVRRDNCNLLWLGIISASPLISKNKKAQNQPQAQGVGYFPRSNQNIGVILSTSLVYVNKGMIEFMRETGERFKILSRLCFSIACYFPE